MLSAPVLLLTAHRLRRPRKHELERVADQANDRLALRDDNALKLLAHTRDLRPLDGHLAAHFSPRFRVAFSVLILADIALYAVVRPLPWEDDRGHPSLMAWLACESAAYCRLACECAIF